MYIYICAICYFILATSFPLSHSLHVVMIIPAFSFNVYVNSTLLYQSPLHMAPPRAPSLRMVIPNFKAAGEGGGADGATSTAVFVAGDVRIAVFQHTFKMKVGYWGVVGWLVFSIG